MEHEKKYTAKQAAIAVLKKAEELLRKSAVMKKAIPEQTASGSPSNAIAEQPAPNKNPAEIAENGNPAPGAFPQNVEKYGAELKGHLKLAKFVGHIESKRKKKPVAAAPAPHQASDEKQGG